MKRPTPELPAAFLEMDPGERAALLESLNLEPVERQRVEAEIDARAPAPPPPPAGDAPRCWFAFQLGLLAERRAGSCR